MLQKQENIGVIFIFTSAIVAGLFPVLVNRGTQNIPPILFAALTTLLAACGSLIYATATGKLSELKNKKAYTSLIMITLCIVIVPYFLLFIGSSKTSGINTSFLLLSEIIFTFLFTHFIGEKTTFEKTMGMIGILIGGAFILYKGNLHFNRGDLLIILSTITYPIGNFYAKKALNFVSPGIILLIRFLLGGLILLLLSFLLEPQSDTLSLLSNNWKIILIVGLISFGLGKILWYEGLKRLDISKAISLAMTFPLFSLIILIGIFKEFPTTLQWIGIVIMMIGVYFSAKRKSVDHPLTKYASEQP